eukprot:1313138-Rhodomonas_salina.1
MNWSKDFGSARKYPGMAGHAGQRVRESQKGNHYVKLPGIAVERSAVMAHWRIGAVTEFVTSEELPKYPNLLLLVIESCKVRYRIHVM